MTRNWLEEAMAYQGVTMFDMAKYMGLSYTYVSDIISGKAQECISPDCFASIAFMLNLDLGLTYELEQEYCAFRDRLRKHTYIDGKWEDRFIYEICECNGEDVGRVLAEEKTMEAAYSRYIELLCESDSRFRKCKDDKERRPYIDCAEHYAQAFLEKAKELIHKGSSVPMGIPHFVPYESDIQVRMTRTR